MLKNIYKHANVDWNLLKLVGMRLVSTEVDFLSGDSRYLRNHPNKFVTVDWSVSCISQTLLKQ